MALLNKRANKNSGSKSGGLLSKYKKPAGRPKIPAIPGCAIYDGFNKNKHVFHMFGHPRERCVKCGFEHPEITDWRKTITAAQDSATLINWDHPYVQHGYWSIAEYKLAMKRTG